MKPYFFILFAFLVMSCASSEDPAINEQLWVYSPENNQVNFDKALLPLLNNYQELLKVEWANGFISSSNQQYDYVLDNAEGHIGLYNYDYNGRSFMFNLVFDPSGNMIKGQYQCGSDAYSATYEIIDYAQFILKFQVTGPAKNYSTISYFTTTRN